MRGVAAMERALQEPPMEPYTWVHKWKGLRPGQQVPPVDKIGALKFQKLEKGSDANERFDLDVAENNGDPKFLCNQLLQIWVVPWWKNDSGYPLPWCAICGAEAWSPVHFFSKHHLKAGLSNPKTWQATWKYPLKCYKCVTST